MSNLKWFGKICLALAAALEFGRILGNVIEGYSPFYLFDLSERFSMDNNTFIIYWGAILGILIFADDFRNINSDSKKFGDQFKNFLDKQEVLGNESIDKSRSKMKNFYIHNRFYYWFQIIGFGICAGFILFLLTMMIAGSVFNVDKGIDVAVILFPLYVYLIARIFHSHYQKDHE